MKLIDLYRVTLTGLFICALNVRGEQGSNNVEKRVDDILSQMTLEEKVNYLAGAPPADPTLPNSTSENVPPVPRLGLPELRNTDGPCQTQNYLRIVQRYLRMVENFAMLHYSLLQRAPPENHCVLTQLRWPLRSNCCPAVQFDGGADAT